MNEKWYIIIETENKESTFICDDSYYEIYYIPSTLILSENQNKDASIIVKAKNQIEAFKKFRNYYINLLKFASKDFYEKELRIQM